MYWNLVPIQKQSIDQKEKSSKREKSLMSLDNTNNTDVLSVEAFNRVIDSVRPLIQKYDAIIEDSLLEENSDPNKIVVAMFVSMIEKLAGCTGKLKETNLDSWYVSSVFGVLHKLQEKEGPEIQAQERRASFRVIKSKL